MNDTLSQPVETVDLGLDLESLLDDDTPDNVAHIVRRVGGIGGPQLVAIAIANRMELQALCGYRFTPTRLDPDLTPCKPCVAAWEALTGGAP